MKKLLFIFLSLVAVVCSMTALSGCAKEEDLGVVVTIESGLGGEILGSNVSQETYDNALASKNRMDARLVKMFGKEFNVKCNRNELPKDEDFIPYSEKISNDSDIQKEIEYLRQLKTLDDEPAVSYVVFHYMAGEREIIPFVIEL